MTITPEDVPILFPETEEIDYSLPVAVGNLLAIYSEIMCSKHAALAVVTVVFAAISMNQNDHPNFVFDKNREEVDKKWHQLLNLTAEIFKQSSRYSNESTAIN